MSAYEHALQLLDGTGPEYDVGDMVGFSNHGPMVAEALCSLGHEAGVAAWVQNYRVNLAPIPPSVQTITTVDWQRSLGDLTRFADWLAFFERQLGWIRWDAVVAEWVPILAPGLAGAAGHGLLRTAHAVRGLGDEPTFLQRRELAHGLAYWAASFQPLPGGPVARFGTAQDPLALLVGLDLLPGEHRGDEMITDRFAALVEHRGIAGATMALDTSGDPATVLGQIVEAAGVTLAVNAAPHSVIALLHGVTATVSLRSLLPFVPAWSISPILTYAWQFVAALHVTFADAPLEAAPLPASATSLASMVERAVRCGDEHAIKLAEASVRMRTKGFAKSLELALERSLPLLGA